MRQRVRNPSGGRLGAAALLFRMGSPRGMQLMVSHWHGVRATRRGPQWSWTQSMRCHRISILPKTT